MRVIAPVTLGAAVGIGSAIFWTLCSILVALAPEPMLATVTRSLFHIRSGDLAVGVTWSGYFVGLVGWTVATGVLAWICAALYDRMLPAGPASSSARG